MTNSLEEETVNFYDILEEQNFRKVVEEVKKKPVYLFRCIDAAINMLGKGIAKDSHFFCLKMSAYLVNEYGIPAVTPFNTKHGVFALKKGLQIHRSKAEEIAILCLAICSFDLTRECISFISDFYKESFKEDFETSNFPDSEEDEQNKFVPFYLKLENLSSNLKFSKEDLEVKQTELEKYYDNIKGDITDQEKLFAEFEFQIIRNYITKLVLEQSQSEDNLSNLNENIEKDILNHNPEDIESVKIQSEVNQYNDNEESDLILNNPEVTLYHKKPAPRETEDFDHKISSRKDQSALEASSRSYDDKKDVLEPSVLKSKNNLEGCEDPPEPKMNSSVQPDSNKKELSGPEIKNDEVKEMEMEELGKTLYALKSESTKQEIGSQQAKMLKSSNSFSSSSHN